MAVNPYFHELYTEPQFIKQQKKNCCIWNRILEFCPLFLWEQNLQAIGLVIKKQIQESNN